MTVTKPSLSLKSFGRIAYNSDGDANPRKQLPRCAQKSLLNPNVFVTGTHNSCIDFRGPALACAGHSFERRARFESAWWLEGEAERAPVGELSSPRFRFGTFGKDFAEDCNEEFCFAGGAPPPLDFVDDADDDADDPPPAMGTFKLVNQLLL